MEHLEKSRQELYDAVDHPALHPLPPTPYEFARLKTCRVNIDYHVEYNKHYYSVPYSLIHAGRRPGVYGDPAFSIDSSICRRSNSTRPFSLGSTSANSSAAMA